MSDPRNLESADLVKEIHALRDDMERMAARMVELSQTLYSKVRRAPSDDYTARYVTFANAWTRFGSMVDGGIRRTSGVARLVASIQQEKIEASEEADRKQREALRAQRAPKQTATAPDLVELYGEEMVNYAAR